MTSLKQRTCPVLGKRNEPGLIALLPTKWIRELRHIFLGAASLGAHLNGVQGVEGSNPFIPTRKQKPQGIYGNVDPFSVFGICPFPLSGVPACRSFRQAGLYGTNFPRRSPDHGDGIDPGRPGRQQTNPSSTNKKATKVSSVAFFICAKHPGPANSRHAFGNSAVPSVYRNKNF